MRPRTLLVTVAAMLAVLLTLFVAPAGAGANPQAAPATTTPIPPTTVATIGTVVDGRPATECISANPRPDCDTASSADGRTLVLMGILLAALSGIAVVVVRSTRRHSRARAADASAGKAAYRQGP